MRLRPGPPRWVAGLAGDVGGWVSYGMPASTAQTVSAESPRPGAAHAGTRTLHHERPRVILGDLEQGLALDQLGEMTGAIYTNDLLDRIFSRFCIGK